MELPKFTLRSLFVGTFLVALAVSAIPTVLRLRFDALYLLSIMLTIYICMLDLISKRESDLWIGLRQCGSACIAILMLGFANQWLLPRPRFPVVSACIICFSLMLLLSSTAFLQLRRTSRLRFRLSYLGTAIIATLVAVNLFQVQDDWYLLARSQQTSSGIENYGKVNVQVRSQMRGRRLANDWDVFFDYVDKSILPFSMTKLRLMCGADGISRLSFSGEMTPQDWRALSSQSVLRQLEFTDIEILDLNCPAFGSLQNLETLLLNDCDIAKGFWQHFPNTSALATLQISGGTHNGLNGLASQSELHSLRILNSQLSTEDLQEIAQLHRLSELVLTGTNLSKDQINRFAEALQANKNHRRVLFRITMDTASREHVAALLDTGAINQINGNDVIFEPIDAQAQN